VRKTKRETIKSWRVRNKVSQLELGKLIGCSRGAVSLIERGLRRPRPDLEERIFRVLGAGVML
jgi:transcriptional regulator with XRE-family HTH domain